MGVVIAFTGKNTYNVVYRETIITEGLRLENTDLNKYSVDELDLFAEGVQMPSWME